MSARLIALDEGSDIPLDQPMIIVGRHPQCGARLDSLRVSRRHCCMAQVEERILVRDLGSTNGIRINGQRVEYGWLKHGDELSIAHIRYRYENESDPRELTVREPDDHAEGFAVERSAPLEERRITPRPAPPPPIPMVTPRPMPVPSGTPLPAKMHLAAPGGDFPPGMDHSLVAAFRKVLPPELKEKCEIEIVVRVPPPAANGHGNGTGTGEGDAACPPGSSP